MENEETKVEESLEETENNEKALPEAGEVQTENVEQTEQPQVEQTEKPKSMFKAFIEDLADRLSLIRSLFYTGIVCAVSIFGFIFFNILRSGFTEDVSMANSCLVLQIFFGIVAVIFVALFITSIVLNIVRRKK